MRNYFEFFDLPTSFQIDEAELKRRYYDNSKRYHPDFHTHADAARQAEMLEMASLNNEAWRTLANHESRTRHLLQLHGLMRDERQTPAMPPDFLMEVMEINEALMDLQMDPDPNNAERARQAIEALRAQLESEAESLKRQWQGPEDLQTLKKIEENFYKKRYLLRIDENLRNFAAHSDE
ncbi:MAG: iron-sulfur cluster co-chaperone HscB C-terminal domain-containing protein [Saprospiraceae bacterium]